MKIHHFYLLLLLISTKSFAQLSGINTKNPQGVVHVDAKKNNASVPPTTTEQADDFVVSTSGNVGIGTTAPTTKLHINNGTSPAITITDGTQDAGKILTSDANGISTWVMPQIKYSVTGDFSLAPAFVTAQGTSGYTNTGVFIKLAPGRWALNAGLAFDNFTTNTFWQNVYLSSDTNTISNTGFNYFPATANKSFAGVITGSVTYYVNESATNSGQNRIGFISGSTVIEVTAATGVTIYLLLQNQPYNLRYSPNFPENYFYAQPIN